MLKGSKKGRKCGACTLCCKLLPVRTLGKGAGERCQYQRNTGCRIYSKPERGFPIECRLWSCQWRVGRPETEHLGRPDRSHYVVDTLPDMIRVRNDSTGEAQEVAVTQIWVDPAYPEAWRAPALLDFIEASGRPALVRYSATEGFGIFPRSVTGLDQITISRNHETAPTITGSRLLDHLTAEQANG